MPRGVTPKERMKRTEITLAKNLKPSGRLNVDDITRAGKMRKTMSRSEFKDSDMPKQAYDTARKVKPSTRLSTDDLKKAKDMMEKKMEKKPAKFTVGKRKSIMEAPQTRTYGNKPTESVFQKLKRAQMLRKMSGK